MANHLPQRSKSKVITHDISGIRWLADIEGGTVVAAAERRFGVTLAAPVAALAIMAVVRVVTITIANWVTQAAPRLSWQGLPTLRRNHSARSEGLEPPTF